MSAGRGDARTWAVAVLLYANRSDATLVVTILAAD
jgi:hypothetical protein